MPQISPTPSEVRRVNWPIFSIEIGAETAGTLGAGIDGREGVGIADGVMVGTEVDVPCTGVADGESAGTADGAVRGAQAERNITRNRIVKRRCIFIQFLFYRKWYIEPGHCPKYAPGLKIFIEIHRI